MEPKIRKARKKDLKQLNFLTKTNTTTEVWWNQLIQQSNEHWEAMFVLAEQTISKNR